ncbi:MAG: HEAT repeat domain-containing protein [Isosphaeraceae bacterium]
MRIAARLFLLGILVLGETVARAGDAGMPAFQVPPGFVVERVAGAPLVRYPLFAEFDDQGRLLVAEGTGANLSAEELRERKLGRITRLEDRDGDGVFDVSRVFADGLVFPQGVLWHDGAVYTASHPSLWKLEDPEDAGRATRRTELVTGFGFNGNGCDLHGPFLGPDGRLYWTDGRHGYKVRTAEGTVLEGLAARIWRCRTDGREVERLCGGGFDNPVELAFTPEGELLGTMDQGLGDCLLHYIEGGVYPMEHPCLAEFPRTGPLLGSVRQYTPVLPAALCGLTRYRSRVFGASFQNQLLSTHYMLHKVVRQDLVADGSTFRAVDTDFLTTTAHDVRLTDVLEDADGSLLVVDMGGWFTYGFPGNPLAKPEAFGAIYRIRKTDAPSVSDPWGKQLGLKHLSAAELVARLDDPRPRVRDQVLARLARLGDAAVPALKAVWDGASDRNREIRREAAWALCRIGTPAALDAVRVALGDPDASVRQVAAHAAGLWRDRAAVPELSRRVASESPPIRRAAAEALGRIGGSDAVSALLDASRNDNDRFADHAIVYAILRCDNPEGTRPALEHCDPRTQRAALVALDQMKNGRLTREEVARILTTEDSDLLVAAFGVVASRSEWSDLTAQIAGAWVRKPDLPAAQEKALMEAFGSLGAEPAIGRLLAQALSDPRVPTPRRVSSCTRWGVVALSPRPNAWRRLRKAASTTPNRPFDPRPCRPRGTYSSRALDADLLRLSQRGDQPVAARVAAIEGVVRRIGVLPEDAFAAPFRPAWWRRRPAHRDLLQRENPGRGHTRRLRPAAAGRCRPDRSGKRHRAFLPRSRGRATRRRSVGCSLRLDRNPAVEGVSLGELDSVLAKSTVEVQQRAVLRERLIARRADKAAYLLRIAAELALVEQCRRRSRALLSARLGCWLSPCGRTRGAIGPDLSRIGAIRTPAELLESILFPDLTIAPEYRTVAVETHDGRVAD